MPNKHVRFLSRLITPFFMCISLAISACSTGEKPSTPDTMPTDNVLTPQIQRPLSLPDLPNLEISDAQQAPLIDLGDSLHIGADVAPSGNFASQGFKNGIQVFSGTAQDAQPAWRVAQAVLGPVDIHIDHRL